MPWRSSLRPAFLWCLEQSFRKRVYQLKYDGTGLPEDFDANPKARFPNHPLPILLAGPRDRHHHLCLAAARLPSLCAPYGAVDPGVSERFLYVFLCCWLVKLILDLDKGAFAVWLLYLLVSFARGMGVPLPMAALNSILYDARTVQPGMSGVGRYTLSLLTALAALPGAPPAARRYF